MGRPRKEKPWCIECLSALPRSLWRKAEQRGSCDTHYRRWLRKFPLCRFEGCGVRLGVPKRRPEPDKKTGVLKPHDPKDSRQGFCRWHDHLLLKSPHRTEEQIAGRLQKFLFAVKPDAVLGCWLWDGRTVNGYGRIDIGGTDWLAHRFSFGFFIGGHRPGLTLDHVCRNALCVRPDHLLPVTLKRNVAMRHRKYPPESIARDLAQIPHMPPNVGLWAVLHGLPVGRAEPGQPFGFGLDGAEVRFSAGPAVHPGAADLPRL